MSDEWQALSLSDCLEPLNDRVGGREIELVLSVTEKRGIVPQSQVFNKRVATSDISKYKVLSPHDIAYNPYLLWTGAVGQWLGEDVGATSPVYECFRVRPGFSARFVGLILESGILTPYFDATAIGSIQRRRRTTPAVFGSASIKVPPLVVQRRIVDLIEHLDNLASCLRSEAETLEVLWWSQAAALEGVAADFPSVPLGAISEISGGLTKNKRTVISGEQVTVPYLRVANVHRRYLDLDELAQIETSADVLERLRLRPGDVLLNEGGDKDKLGRGAVWRGEVEDCIHQNHVFRARIRDEDFLPEFVSAWTNSFGREWFLVHGTQTTGIASVSKSTLSKLPVPALPIPEQRRWSDSLAATFETSLSCSLEADEVRSLRGRILGGLLNRSLEIPDDYDDFLMVSS